MKEHWLGHLVVPATTIEKQNKSPASAKNNQVRMSVKHTIESTILLMAKVKWIYVV